MPRVARPRDPAHAPDRRRLTQATLALRSVAVMRARDGPATNPPLPCQEPRVHDLLIFIVGLLIGLALSGAPLMTVPDTGAPRDDKRLRD